MTFQDSDSDLSVKMGASLTPPAPRARHVHLPRDQQSSGFFDLDALYASMNVEQARPPPLPPRLPPPLPPTMSRRSRPAQRASEGAVARPRRVPRPKPMGWFAVFVAWLVTTTLATLAATQLPAHLRLRSRPAIPATVATIVAGVSSSASSSAAPTVPVPAPASSVAPSATAIPVDQLPAAGASGSARAQPSSTPHAKHVVQRTAPAALTARATAAPEAAPVPPPTSAPPQMAPIVKAAPASTANMSLDELIRHEVAAEQKRLHPNAPPP
jgi:hypothetical protein